MNDSLEQALSRVKCAPIPPMEAGFNRSVWNEIELRRAAERSWFAFWQRPALIAAALLFAAVAGSAAAFAQITPAPSTRVALGLDVFSGEPKHLPSGLLARSK